MNYIIYLIFLNCVQNSATRYAKKEKSNSILTLMSLRERGQTDIKELQLRVKGMFNPIETTYKADILALIREIENVFRNLKSLNYRFGRLNMMDSMVDRTKMEILAILSNFDCKILEYVRRNFNLILESENMLFKQYVRIALKKERKAVNNMFELVERIPSINESIVRANFKYFAKQIEKNISMPEFYLFTFDKCNREDLEEDEMKRILILCELDLVEYEVNTYSHHKTKMLTTDPNIEYSQEQLNSQIWLQIQDDNLYEGREIFETIFIEDDQPPLSQISVVWEDGLIKNLDKW